MALMLFGLFIFGSIMGLVITRLLGK